MTTATETTNAPRVIGTATNYLELISTFRARMAELGITYSTLDEIAGWTDSYSTKVLGEEPLRHLGVMAFDAMINALALKVVVVDDPQKLEKIKKHRHFVPRRHRMRATGSQGYVALRVTRPHLQEIASAGGRARAAKLSARKLRAIGRKGAEARWKKPKLVEIKPAP
jgi:hypothetical protein